MRRKSYAQIGICTIAHVDVTNEISDNLKFNFDFIRFYVSIDLSFPILAIFFYLVLARKSPSTVSLSFASNASLRLSRLPMPTSDTGGVSN